MVGTYSRYELPGIFDEIDLVLIEGNVFWTPVENLDLGVAVLCGSADHESASPTPAPDTDDLRVTGRIQRDF